MLTAKLPRCQGKGLLISEFTGEKTSPAHILQYIPSQHFILYVPYHSHVVATSEEKSNFESFEHLSLLSQRLFIHVF